MTEVKVLIVDDEKEFASTLAERLILRGFAASAVHCAEDALALIHAGDIPEVILLDLKMPLMDGMEALAAIKEYDPAIEVIILTGHGSGGAVGVDAKKGAAFDCIMKPVDIKELTQKINLAAAKRRQYMEQEK